MMSENKLLLLFVFHLFCLGIFLKGFFPVDNVKFQNSISNIKINRSNFKTSKLVFLIIDAIRLDFISPDQPTYLMPFVQNSIITNKSCFMNIVASAPTVTMPRIKALTSGTLPNFLDIVINLGSSEFNQDTFLRQATNAGLRTVFYGDDTWLKMFPNAFVRSGGTHSFFATDYWEVDNNITLAVREELKRNDWDVMIIHYLGLDHIGHIEGPRSRLIPIKLREMDGIIEEISNILLNYTGTKFIVTGDHGMKDSGGHGGVTSAEVNVPLVMVGDPCRQLIGWPERDKRSTDQVDIAATISIALGLPLPSASIGKIIPELLNNFSDFEILEYLKIIRRNLLKHLSKVDETDSWSTDTVQNLLQINNNTFIKETISKYYLKLTILSEELLRNRVDYDLKLMLLGCLLLWSCLIVYLAKAPIPKPKNPVQFLLFFGSIFHSFSLASSSFIEEEHQTWYFLWATFLIFSLRGVWKAELTDKNNFIFKMWPFIFISIQHRLLRKLNQTGDKWASLPDWDDYFRESPRLLFLLFFASVLWLYRCFSSISSCFISRALFAGCLLSVTAYKTAVGTFSCLQFDVIYPQSRGNTEAQVFYLLFTFFIISSYYSKVAFHWIWSLIICLTLRSHNIILVPTQVYVSSQLYKIFPNNGNSFWNSLAHIWMGYIFYFYQGNSNNFATIDVAPAFIACDQYLPIYGALMTAIHTYAAHGFALFLSPANLSSVLLLRFLPVTIYTSVIISQRHHLFIWSVFSPKLLLETAFSIFIFLLLFVKTIGALMRFKTGFNKKT